MPPYHPTVRGLCYDSTSLFYYQLVVLGLLWLCVMLHTVWPSRCAMVSVRSPTSTVSGSLLTGSTAVHTQCDERDRRRTAAVADFTGLDSTEQNKQCIELDVIAVDIV